MAGGNNLAVQYSGKVDERFARESQAMLAMGGEFEFTGAKTVNVYSIPVVPMTDYVRAGSSRYGTPNDLGRSVQSMQVTRDRAFTFIIDRGDKAQSRMVSDAGKALAREIREVWAPEFDAYCFKTLAQEAAARGSADATVPTKENAYSLFLAAMERLGNQNVPDKGRVCFCSYRYANLLKQDPAFVRGGDASQRLLQRGVIGEVDGCRILMLPCDTYNFSPDNRFAEVAAYRSDKVILHFKGERKRLMGPYWQAWLRPRSASILARLQALAERRRITRHIRSEARLPAPTLIDEEAS